MRYILFDIDGTLTAGGTGGSSGVLALNLAFEELFGLADGFSTIQMAGKTDPIITREAFHLHGIELTREDSKRLRERYLHHLGMLIAMPGRQQRVLPGVRDILDALYRREDVALGLLTGNWREGARMKLASAGLDAYFTAPSSSDASGTLDGFGLFGAFGDDATIRAELVPVAWRRFREHTGRDVAPKETIIIGDTPRDVECAQANGTRSIAVATGPYSVEELRASNADEVLANLGDTETVLRLLLR